MIENVRAAMGRVEAIRATIQGPSTTGATAEPARTRSARPAGAAAQFNQVLASAVQRQTLGNYLAQSGGGITTQPSWWSSPSLTGRYDANAPRGLEGFGNGQIPLDRLRPISGTDERMWAPAAESFTRMRADARRAGIDLPVIDAYRPIEDQYRLADELGLYKDGGWAAVPGTSQHGWGRAIDLELDDEALTWMRQNAGRYGFVENVPREPWHWEFHG
ncbi:MAG: M15 family metallopeptidase [Actinomycetota bacterium]